MQITEIDKQELIEKVISQSGFKVIREEALKLFKSCSKEECYSLGMEFYQSKDYQVQELGVFLFGYIADTKEEALIFMKNDVSTNEDWRVQEILAMAFDSYCKATGYEAVLPVIKEWLADERVNVKRAVTEGLRIWTSRPFFKQNPEIAVELLSNLKQDESEYVRKSVGNALRDISKKFPDLIKKELDSWDVNNKKISQVYKLAVKLIK